MRRLMLALALALMSTAAFPTAASASPYSAVLRVYRADGSIPPCKFSSAELSAALKGVDTYGQQYFADFSQAVQSALAARASGACTPGSRPSPARGALGNVALPASVTSSTDAGIPLPILLMGALALLLTSALGLRAIARALGWVPQWAAGWRHAWAEAAYRVGGGWDEVVDWWRSRR